MEKKWTKGLKQQLVRDIEQGTKLINAISGLSDIRNIMVKHGYSAEEHELGLRMLAGLLCFERPWPETEKSFLPVFKEIVSEVNDWGKKNLMRGRTALDRDHSEQGGYLFDGLDIQSGMAMMAALRQFFERGRTLRQGSDPKREESREADRAAVEVLESRNIAGPEVEEYLLKRIDEAFALSSSHLKKLDRDKSEAYLDLAGRFHLWLRDWRQTARSVITNRRHLISLGLAKAKTRARK